jgi:MFS family permease
MATTFYGWWIVLACFFIALYIGGALFYGFTVFFEPIVREFGWSYTQVSIAFSLRGLEMGILAPITGFLVDRFGSRNLILFGSIIIGFALILLSLTNSLLMFYSAFVLLALGTSGCASTVLMTAVAHWFRRKAGRAMGLVVCGFGAGGILIPLIAWLIALYEWRTVLVILGFGMWGLGIPLSFVIRHKPEHYGILPDGDISVESDDSQASRDRGVEANFKDAVRSKNFWTIGVAEAIRVMIAMAVITHVMPYLSSIGMSRGSAAFLAACIPLFSIVGRFGFGWLGDAFDKKYVMAVVYSLFGMGTLAFSVIHLEWLVVPFLLLFCPAFGGTVSLRGAIVREYFGRASFGKLIGIIIGLAAIGGVIGPSAAGWAFDNLGSYQPVWLSFAAATVIPIGLILGLQNPQKDREGR